MRALIHLRRFINAKNNDEERTEIREYLHQHVEELSRAFGVTENAFTQAIEGVDDDVELALRITDGLRRASSKYRARQHEERARSAQQSAEILGAIAQWNGERAEIDVLSLLSSALTRRQDMLIFVADRFAVGVRMAPLFDLRRLGRWDVSGWVDARGLHVRWSTGGLNFYPVMNPHAERIIVPLAGRARIAA